jgi:pantothenate kinase
MCCLKQNHYISNTSETLRLCQKYVKKISQIHVDMYTFEGETNYRQPRFIILVADSASSTNNATVNITDPHSMRCNDTEKAIVCVAGDDIAHQRG